MSSRIIDRPGTLSARVRRAREEGWLWTAVVGDQEVERGSVNIKGIGEIPIDDLPGLMDRNQKNLKKKKKKIVCLLFLDF